MAQNPSVKKRLKEAARLEHQRHKAAKRQQRRAAKASSGPRVPGEDPDIAGIIPGPQPILED